MAAIINSMWMRTQAHARCIPLLTDWPARTLVMLALLLLAVPALASSELRLFRNAGFSGPSLTLSEPNSQISFSPRSIKLEGEGTWLLCPRPFFGGQCMIVDKDKRDLRLPRAFSGTVQSARPVASAAPLEDPAPVATKPEEPPY